MYDISNLTFDQVVVLYRLTVYIAAHDAKPEIPSIHQDLLDELIVACTDAYETNPEGLSAFWRIVSMWQRGVAKT